MRLLAHVCCAPCWLACAPAWDRLVAPAGRWQALFVNPNVHPLIEFRRRLKAVQVLAHDRRWPLLAEEGYGLRKFLDEVDWRGEGRCGDCYRLRLRATAEEARQRGFDHFTTTLLASIHQCHQLVSRVGEEVGRQVGVEFVAEDWRPLAGRGHEEARRRSLYLQQYCGCIFSEFERYRDTGFHLYRHADDPVERTSPLGSPSAAGDQGRGGRTAEGEP